MSRRRNLPWIYRWSRPIIGAIAIIGAILTSYLTITKLSGAQVACSAGAAEAGSSCNNVLDSPYGTIFGLPLSFFGLLAYLSMAIFALSPLFINPDTQKRLKKTVEDWTWLFLLIGGTAMTIFSGYLMSVLAFDLKAVCYYCIASALFSLSLLLLTLFGRSWEDLGQIFFIGVMVGMITLVGTFAVYANVNLAQNPAGGAPLIDGKIPIERPNSAPETPFGWKITSVSGPSEIALAEHLTSIGAKEYGAYWCPHCFDQKQLFGQEAFSKIQYVECDPQGKNSQTQACQAAGVNSFPTWEIKGKLYPGTQTLEELAELSEYKGATDFKYTLKRAP